MDPLALYGAVLATLSLVVSGANFLRDRARLRIYPWLGDREGGYSIANIQMDQIWLRIINHGRHPIALRRAGLSFRCKRRFLFGPRHPPEPPFFSAGVTTETHTEFSPPAQLDPLKETVLSFSLSYGVINGHDCLEAVWVEDLVEHRYHVDRIALWLLRRDINRLRAERKELAPRDLPKQLESARSGSNAPPNEGDAEDGQNAATPERPS